MELKRTSKGLSVKGEFKNIEDFVNYLSDYDIYLHPSDTGWAYLMDTNTGDIYYVDDYHFNKLKELFDKGETLFPVVNDWTDEDKEELWKEFNEGKDLSKVVKKVLEAKDIKEIRKVLLTSKVVK